LREEGRSSNCKGKSECAHLVEDSWDLIYLGLEFHLETRFHSAEEGVLA